MLASGFRRAPICASSPSSGSYSATVLTSDVLLEQFAQWLVDTSASSTLGSVPLITAYIRHTAISAKPPARAWASVTTDVTTSQPLMTFTTPFGGTPGGQRGRVLFTDLHGSAGDASSPSATFPTGDCTSSVTQLMPEDKMLLYGIFDLQRCVNSSGE